MIQELECEEAVFQGVTGDAAPVCLDPVWPENSHRLESLWVILQVYAMNFVRVGAQMARCTTNIGAAEYPQNEADEKIIKQFSEIIETIEYDTDDVGLKHTREIVAYHKKILARGGMTYDE